MIFSLATEHRHPHPVKFEGSQRGVKQSLIVSMSCHLVLFLILVLGSWHQFFSAKHSKSKTQLDQNSQAPSMVPASQTPVLQAVHVDEKLIQEQIKQVQLEKQKEQQVKQQTEQRLKAEQAKLQTLKAAMEQEKKKLLKLDEKRQEEQERLEQVRRQRESEQKKLEDVKKKQRKVEMKAQEEQSAQAAVVAEEAKIQGEADSTQNAYQGIFESYWNKPIGTEGLVCVVSVKLQPDGFVDSVRTVQQSGNPAFDESAERSVWKASPLSMHPDPRVAAKLREITIKFINSGA